MDHALAIHEGSSTWEMCFPLQKQRLRDAERSLEAVETLDPVTGLWSPRSLKERLGFEGARYSRYRTPVSLVVLDVDDFGHVNDTCGERVGNHVLRALGERIASLLRSTDMLARYDGDRFAVLLPGIGKTAAFAVSEKLRDAVRADSVHVEADGYTHEVSLTLSAGVTSASPSREGCMALLESAETAHITVMAAGKDQVTRQ